MNFLIARKLGFKLDKVIHVGAHKFEESSEYEMYGSKKVFWIDPFPQRNPEILPSNQEFLKTAIDNVASETTRDFQIYEATGFSSFYELDSPGSIIRGTPSIKQTVEVKIDSLRNIQNKYELSNFRTLIIDTQGSEFDILKSTNLENIDEIIVETSRVALYKNESSHEDVDKFLTENGFIHNFNDSDFLYGHGDQYYSRDTYKMPILELRRRSVQTFNFYKSILKRILIGVIRRSSLALRVFKV